MILKGFRYSIAVFAGALLFSSCPNGSGGSYAPAAPVRFGIPKDFMGMVHAGYRSGTEEDSAREYALLDEMGVQWMLRDFSWSDIQTGKDTWNLGHFDAYVNRAKGRGKKVLAILDYDVGWIHDGTYSDDPYTDSQGHEYISPQEIPRFCEYAKRTVEHYRGKVDAWCIWNEPNLQPRFWTGTKEEFFALTKAAAAAIREADPDAFIIGGALNTLATEDWARGLFTSGAMDQVDAVAFHPYMPSPGPTVNIFKRFKEWVTPYGFGDKIWITEVGYPTYGTYGTEVAEDKMPETVLQTLVFLTTAGAERILWYELFDHGDAANKGDAENWFGLINGDNFEKRKGAHAYQLFARNIPGTDCKTPERLDLPDSIQAYYFEAPGGRCALVVWNETAVISRQVEVYLPGRNQRTYNIDSGESSPVEETGTYTLKTKDGEHHFIRFFTWERPTTKNPLPPRISS